MLFIVEDLGSCNVIGSDGDVVLKFHSDLGIVYLE